MLEGGVKKRHGDTSFLPLKGVSAENAKSAEGEFKNLCERRMAKGQ